MVDYVFANLAGMPGGIGNVDGAGRTARFFVPSGVAVDTLGSVYVADRYNHVIRKVGPTGLVVTLAGLAGCSGQADGAGPAARFNYPAALAVDTTGNVYVADTYNDLIRKITPTGVVTTLAGLALVRGNADGAGSAARFSSPSGIAVDRSGKIYVADTENHVIRTVRPDGVVGTLSAATFGRPYGIAVDASGHLFVADESADTIKKVAPDGTLTTFAGSSWFGSADGTGAAAQFRSPSSVAVNAEGIVFVADTGNGTIRKITPDRVVTTLAGLAGRFGYADGSGNAARFNYPYGVAVDGNNNVIVGDSDNHQIRKISSLGEVTTLAGSAPGSGSSDGVGADARFDENTAIAVDGYGNAYVTDWGSHTIRKVTPAGEVTTLAGLADKYGLLDGTGSAARFNYPYGVAVDGVGNIYVADSANSAIRKVSPEGTVATLAGGKYGYADGMGSAARFALPFGIAVDGSGTLYVADRNNHTIRKITPQGSVTTLAGVPWKSGETDGTGSAARFNSPQGLTVDAVGYIYVADTGNHTIRRISSEGAVITLAGSALQPGSADGTRSSARFNAPTSLALDATGNLYVADRSNSSIRLLTSSGVVTTLAGMTGYAASKDGIGTAAIFSYPQGVAVGEGGSIYVADTGNNRVSRGAPIPVVAVAKHDGSIILSWSTIFRNVIVEGTATLQPSSWQPLVNDPSLVTTPCTLTNTSIDRAAFFRLRLQ